MIDILAVDDSGARLPLYEKETDLVAITSIEAMASDDPRDSKYVTGPQMREYQIGIVDFHLDFRGQTAAESPLKLADGTPVTTGIGVMSWLRERRPDLRLYAATGRKDPHAVWFMPAAFLWFGAVPLDTADVENEILNGDAPRGYGLHAFLKSDRPEETELFDDTDRAARAFARLMDCSLENETEREVLRWLSLFTQFGHGMPRLKEIRDVAHSEFGVNSGQIWGNRFPGQVYRMQQQIADMWREFGYRDHSDGWPTTDPAKVNDLSMTFFQHHCPVFDEVRNHYVKTFVTAPDVLHAQRAYRASQAGNRVSGDCSV